MSMGSFILYSTFILIQKKECMNIQKKRIYELNVSKPKYRF